VNAQLLTDPEALAHRFLELTGNQLTDQDAAGINFPKVWRKLMCGTVDAGRALTPRPKFWFKTNPNGIDALE
jgi:hypothetical protein